MLVHRPDGRLDRLIDEVSIPEVPRLGHSAVCRRGRSLEPLQMPLEIASEPELSESLQNQVNEPPGGIEPELYRHTHLFQYTVLPNPKRV